MLIVDCVVDEPPCTAGSNQPHSAKQPQLVRSSRFADPDELGYVADAQLAAAERVEDAHSSRVAEHAERLSQPFDSSRGHEDTAARSNPVFVQVRGCIAGLRGCRRLA